MGLIFQSCNTDTYSVESIQECAADHAELADYFTVLAKINFCKTCSRLETLNSHFLREQYNQLALQALKHYLLSTFLHANFILLEDTAPKNNHIQSQAQITQSLSLAKNNLAKLTDLALIGYCSFSADIRNSISDIWIRVNYLHLLYTNKKFPSTKNLFTQLKISSTEALNDLITKILQALTIAGFTDEQNSICK